MKSLSSISLVLTFFTVATHAAEERNTSHIDAYVSPTASGVEVMPLLNVGDTALNGYKLVGNPDGLGAIDLSNGKFKLFMNHEVSDKQGIKRAHGHKGAFVSEWVIDKATLSVLEGADFVKSPDNIYLWNVDKWSKNSTAFSKLCSANLPSMDAFYNKKSGKGYSGQFFMSGEENGSEGRAFAFVVNGKDAGNTYELPKLGKFSRENSLINPYLGDKTILVGTEDADGGHVYVYIGSKTTTGNSVESAGLNNGKLYVLRSVKEGEVSKKPAQFSLVEVNTEQSGKSLSDESDAKGATPFSRPEDGHWASPDTFYFVTTGNNINTAKVFKLKFTQTSDFSLGGTISLHKDSFSLIGKDNQIARSFDNMTVSDSGDLLIQEDPGKDPYISKIWHFSPKNNQWMQILESNRKYFSKSGDHFLTENEEHSGVIDITKILNRNDGKQYFIATTQAHYNLTPELVNGGQLYVFSINQANIK